MINLKKLFAAAMAMAMVVTVAPAKAVTVEVCTAEKKQDAESYAEVMNELVAAIEDVTTLEEVNYNTIIDWNGDGVYSAGETVKAVLDAISAAELENVAKCGPTASDKKTAKFLGGLVAGIDTLEGHVVDLLSKVVLADDFTSYKTSNGTEVEEFAAADGEWVNAPTYALLSTEVATAKTLYNNLTKSAYVDNMADSLKEIYETYLPTLEELLEDAGVEFYEEDYAAYLLALEGKQVIGLTTVAEIIADYEARVGGLVKHGDYKAIYNAIEEIEEADEYELFGEEAEVEEILEILTTVAEEAEYVNGLVSTKNTAYKALKKADGTNLSLVVTGKDAFNTSISNIKLATLEAIYDYYEEITTEFYGVEVSQRKNGKFYVTYEPTELVDYLETADETRVKAGLYEAMGTLVDNEEDETTYLDLFLARVEAVEEAYEAVTEGVNGITINNLSTKNVDAVVAAKEGLDLLTTVPGKTPGAYSGHLTTAQKNAVNAKAEKIDVLYIKALYFVGVEEEVEVDGWVELGNGNWDYYADGEAFTGWVAAGSNWYYVSEGHMLRSAWVASAPGVWYYVGNDGAMVANTTVDGWVIGADGKCFA